MNKAKTWCAAFALLLGLGACSGDSQTQGGNGPDNNGGVDAGVADDAAPELDPFETALEEREYDYSAALRIAALRLTGDLPTLTEIKSVAEAADQKTAYETLVTAYIADPRFANTQIDFWKNTFRMGGTPELDTAGVLAAQLVVEGRPLTELLTATTGTCPTYDDGTGIFTAVDCDNGVPVHSGLLTHPGMNAHFTSNMAFRRVRWVQETFACTAFPAEISAQPEALSDTALYTAPWEFTSISGIANGGDIDFLDYQSVVCANCHATMNHMAPLFGYFDDQGVLSDDIFVPKPVEGNPPTELIDWLPAGEVTAWRVDAPAADLPALGAAMAADPRVAECSVARAWNWAMGKGDIVDTLAAVPPAVFQAQHDEFIANGYDYKTLLYRVFTSDDFVQF